MMRQRLIPFIIKCYGIIMDKNKKWQQMISCLSEIDCLCSLSKLALEVKFNLILIKI